MSTSVQRITKIFEAFLCINPDIFHKDIFDINFIKMEYYTIRVAIDIKEKIFTLKYGEL